MSLNNLDQVELTSKYALVRVDFNVPFVNGQITDTTRIERHLPTILELQEKGARIILVSHLGRPTASNQHELSLAPLASLIKEKFALNIKFVADTIGEKAKNAISELQDGEILLLENVRFYEQEEKNDPQFAQALANLADIYIQDAFSVAHRAHASTAGVGYLLPSYAGRAMQAELEALSKGLEAPEHPVIAIVGGAKVSTKIDLLLNLVSKVDALVIGGAMANTFLLAQGHQVGASLVEESLVETANLILRKAEEHNCALILPIDVVVAWHLKADSPYRVYGAEAVPNDGMILDIGERSRLIIEAAIKDAKTVLWNGPLGAFEFPPFNEGTNFAAKVAAAQTSQGKLISVAGGGDTVSALNQAGVDKEFSYISTAGGAFLEWLEGKELPGVKILYKA